MPADRAVITAAKGRLRPIIMTGCAMIAGMIPMSLGLEEGSEQNAPLARAVIGGMALATFATLLVLPAVFTLLLGRASERSPSLDPDDPASVHYDPINPADAGGPGAAAQPGGGYAAHADPDGHRPRALPPHPRGPQPEIATMMTGVEKTTTMSSNAVRPRRQPGTVVLAGGPAAGTRRRAGSVVARASGNTSEAGKTAGSRSSARAARIRMRLSARDDQAYESSGRRAHRRLCPRKCRYTHRRPCQGRRRVDDMWIPDVVSSTARGQLL